MLKHLITTFLWKSILTGHARNLLLNKSNEIFDSELIKKIEIENYINKNSIEIIKNIPEIMNYVNNGTGLGSQSPTSLAVFNIIDDESVKENYNNAGSDFCPNCNSFLRSRSYFISFFFNFKTSHKPSGGLRFHLYRCLLKRNKISFQYYRKFSDFATPISEPNNPYQAKRNER